MGEAMSNTQSARTCHSPFERFSAQRLLKSNRVEVQLCRKKEQRNESSKGRPSGLVHPINDLQSPDRLRKERRTQESDAERRSRQGDSERATARVTHQLHRCAQAVRALILCLHRFSAYQSAAHPHPQQQHRCRVLCFGTVKSIIRMSSWRLGVWSLDSLQDFESVNKLSLADDIRTYILYIPSS